MASTSDPAFAAAPPAAEGGAPADAGAWWNLPLGAVATAHVAVAVVCTGFVTIPRVPASVAALERFIEVSQLIGYVAVALALSQAALGGIALLHEGTLRSRRAWFRLASIGCLLPLVPIAHLALVPLLKQLSVSGLQATPALVLGVAQWHWLGLGCVVLSAAFVAAGHRAPVSAVPVVTRSGLTLHHRRVLFLLGAATLFHGYDMMIATLALPYIGRDLGAGVGELGLALALVRVGALASVIAGRLADLHGRSRLLVVSVLFYTIATGATAFSTGLIEFVIYQLVAQIFLASELVLAQVIVSEEFPDGARGHGQGLLGAFNGIGGGLAAILFPLFQSSALGWRGMYLVGLVPLAFLALLRRAMPESTRWRNARRVRPEQVPIGELLHRSTRVQLVGLTLLSFSTMGALSASFAFSSHHLTTAFAWTPGEVSSLIIGAGAAGLSANFFIGRVADRFGRRRVGFGGAIGAAAGLALFYHTPWLAPGFALMAFCETATHVAGNALFTESFPTRLRATAKSWGGAAGVLGALTGLGAIGLFANAAGGAPAVITGLGLVMLCVAPLYLLVPETAGASLDRLDRAATPASAD